MNNRVYPDESAGSFPTPPATISDKFDRPIEIRPLEADAPDDADALAEMYVLFDPADRAQGIPPTGEKRIRQWIEPLLSGINIAAWHEDSVVGHATLVPDIDDPAALETNADVDWELAIFVLQEYQEAGIGTQLLMNLLGYASEQGVKRVWLTVERWNAPAIALYERVGFELCGAESFEQVMSIRLA